MSFPFESLMVIFTSPLLSATLFDRVPFGVQYNVYVLSNLVNLDSLLMTCAVAPHFTSSVSGFLDFT